MRPPSKLSRREVLGLTVAGSLTVLVGGYYGVDALIHEAKSISESFTNSGGTNVSGSFYSTFRKREVGYTIGYPKGHVEGSALPLIVFFHGFRGTHEHGLAGYSPSEAVSVRTNGRQVRPMAIVTVDGGGGYWHPHPLDDPMGMVMHELIPMMNHRGLGVAPNPIFTMGISMGGYGAIAFAENFPHVFSAVAAISPAIFVTYEHVKYVNPGAYWSASDFARYDAVTHTASLRQIPLRVASGLSDPFHPWVQDFVSKLVPGNVVVFAPGGHDGAFFYNQIAPSIEFLANQL